MTSNIDAAGKFYLDSHNLDAMRLQAAKDPKQALSAVSKQFEAVMMSMMLKSMRDATPQDGPFDSEQTKMYMSMLDQQLSQSLSQKGMGLAEVMVRQLSQSPPKSAQPQAEARNLLEIGQSAPSMQPKAVSGNADFVSSMLPYAQDAESATGIPAKFMLGQAALETGWGKHEIKSASGRSSHNLFGIKADRGWKGAVMTALTTEYVDGVPRKVYQNFRAYDSYADSFKDYAHMLASNPRYANAVESGRDAAKFAEGLQSAGYATDPSYSEKLRRIFNADALQSMA